MLYVLILLVFSDAGYIMRPAGAYETADQCAVMASKAAATYFANCRPVPAEQVAPSWRSARI